LIVAASTDAKFDLLPTASFRGIGFPVVDRDHTFSHETAPHQVVFRDGVATEMLGINGRQFSYSAPIRESIVNQRRQFKNLFTKQLSKLYDAFRDTTPGPLVDPIHGNVTVTPGTWNEHATWQQTDGIDLKFNFTEYTAIGKPVKDNPPTIDAFTGSARQLDDQVVVAPWPKQVPQPKPTVDPLTAFAGLINQVNVHRNLINANIARVGFLANKVEEAATRAGGRNAPDSKSAAIFNSIRLAARKLRIQSWQLANAPPRDKAQVAVQQVFDTPKTIMQLAADSRMTLETLLSLNPGLARQNPVPRGTRVWVYPPAPRH
jgi:hypothetical protein